MNTVEITIRSIQHYMYCPRRWGLLEIDKAWAENIFVTKANLMHERVHDPDRHYTSKGKKVFTSVPVYHDLEDYNLYGIIDCLEVTEAQNGVCINGSKEKYEMCIVEYKPTKPKAQDYNKDDLMQVFAQKVCVDYIFGSNCSAVLYYADVKKRISLPVVENYAEYDSRLRRLLTEMRQYFDRGIVPEIRKGQKCSGCSMKDLCMPSIKRRNSVEAEIKEICRTEIGEQLCESF